MHVLKELFAIGRRENLRLFRPVSIPKPIDMAPIGLMVTCWDNQPQNRKKTDFRISLCKEMACLLVCMCASCKCIVGVHIQHNRTLTPFDGKDYH